MARDAIDRGLDPVTELPALFADRRVRVLAQGGIPVEAARRLVVCGLRGVVILAGSHIGVWGEMEIVPAPPRPL